MIHTIDRAPARTKRQQPWIDMIDQAAHVLRAYAAAILRAMILVLVSLLFVLVGLMLLTGNVAIGLPFIASVLFSGFGAAQFARS